MNNIKLLKAQSKLALSAVDERLKIGIQRYIEALEAKVAELEAKLLLENSKSVKHK